MVQYHARYHVWYRALHPAWDSGGEVLAEACGWAATDLINTAFYEGDCVDKRFCYNLIIKYFYSY